MPARLTFKVTFHERLSFGNDAAHGKRRSPARELALIIHGKGDRRASPPERRQMGLCLGAACITKLWTGRLGKCEQGIKHQRLH
jgi:hypothetical protein